MNAPHMHLSLQSICHDTILLTTSSALSFIMYACRTILGGTVIDNPRHSAFVGNCTPLQLAGYVRSSHITIASYIRVTYELHFLFQASAGC